MQVPTISPEQEAAAVEDVLAVFAVTHPDHPEAGEVITDGRGWPAMQADGWVKVKAKKAKD
jgi:hypothetical protein